MNTALLIGILVAVVIVGIVAGLVLAMSRRSRLRGLPAESRTRYAQSWQTIETRFIDHPREAVREADRLAVDILSERGARLGESGQVPGDLRAAREAAAVDAGEAGGSTEGASDGTATEGLRRAMVRYQAIVDDAVGESERRRAESGKMEVIG